MYYIKLNKDNIDREHICSAFSDKKCVDSYELKKQWLKNEFTIGHVFLRHDEHAIDFIEYGPAETAWVPVIAPDYMMIGCFWVSGKYKRKGHGKALLQQVVDKAKAQGKSGIVTVIGTNKFHFLSDTKWLLKHGYKMCENTPAGFNLISMDLIKTAIDLYLEIQ